MVLRDELLDLLRSDQAFREEVRRQLLTDEVLELPGRLAGLIGLVGQALAALGETTGAIRSLGEAHQRAEERLRRIEEALDRQGEEIASLARAQQRTEEALQRQGDQIQALIDAQRQQGNQIEALVAAQQRTEGALERLVTWQRGEGGRRDGERYERETIRRAPWLFNGGRGGSPDQPWVQQQLTDLVGPLLARGVAEAEEDPFLADLLWWKAERIAVVEISVQVNGYDVVRAARRAATLRRAGAQALAVVIGEDWATSDSLDRALAREVEWKVGSHLSDGFLAFRRAPSG